MLRRHGHLLHQGRHMPAALADTEGGEDTVYLNGRHYPKHLHWSSMVSSLPSVAISQSQSARGDEGSAIFKNTPISGGVKYGFACGTGPYKVNINDFGSSAKKGIPHNNVPPYGTLSVYLVT